MTLNRSPVEFNEELDNSTSSLNINETKIVGCNCWNINLTYLPLKNFNNSSKAEVKFETPLNKGNWVKLVAEGIKIGFLNLVKILSFKQFRTISCFNCETFLYSYLIEEGESEGLLTPKDQIIFLHTEQFDLKHFENIKNNDQFSQVFKLLYSNKDLPILNEENFIESKSIIRDHTLQQYLKKRKLIMLEKIEAYKQQQYNEFKAIERTAKLHYNYLEQKTQQINLFKPESISSEFSLETKIITPLTDDISITPPTHSLTNFQNQDLDYASSLKITEIDQLMNLSKYHQNSKSSSSSKLVSPILNKKEIEGNILEEEGNQDEEELNEKDDMFFMDEDIPKLPVESNKPNESQNLTGGEKANASNFYSRPGTSFTSSKYFGHKFSTKFNSGQEQVYEEENEEEEENNSIPTMATSVPVTILYHQKFSKASKAQKPTTISESLDEDQVNPISATFVAPHVLSSRTLKDDKEKLFGDVPTSKINREFLYN